VRREDDGSDVSLDVSGGRVAFRVAEPEHVYYWWRGPEERPGVRLLGVRRTDRETEEADSWPTRTAG